MNRAVFLDRDGTIVEDVDYMFSPDQIRFIGGACEAIKLLNDANYKVIIISNQSGVARGKLDEAALQAIDKSIKKLILSSGAYIDASYYCPHHPHEGSGSYRQECECRKPSPGMIKRSAREHNIDLKNSYMVGDKETDIKAGKNAGCKVILISNNGSTIAEESDYIARDILEAVNWIISRDKAHE